MVAAFVLAAANCRFSAFGLLGGIAASSSAVAELMDARLAPPCYAQWLSTGFGSHAVGGASTHCCGSFGNVTVSGVDPRDFCL